MTKALPLALTLLLLLRNSLRADVGGVPSESHEDSSIAFLGFIVNPSTFSPSWPSTHLVHPGNPQGNSLEATVRIDSGSMAEALTHVIITQPGQFWQPDAWTWTDECLANPEPELGFVLSGKALAEVLPLVQSGDYRTPLSPIDEQFAPKGEKTCQDIPTAAFRKNLGDAQTKCLRNRPKIHLHAVECQWDSQFRVCAQKISIQKKLPPGIWRITGTTQMECEWAMRPENMKYDYPYYSMYMSYPSQCSPTIEIQSEDALSARLRTILDALPGRLKENWQNVLSLGERLQVPIEWPGGFPSEANLTWESDSRARAVMRLGSVQRPEHLLAVELHLEINTDARAFAIWVSPVDHVQVWE